VTTTLRSGVKDVAVAGNCIYALPDGLSNYQSATRVIGLYPLKTRTHREPNGRPRPEHTTPVGFVDHSATRRVARDYFTRATRATRGTFVGWILLHPCLLTLTSLVESPCCPDQSYF
jgi:hypothetical protein